MKAQQVSAPAQRLWCRCAGAFLGLILAGVASDALAAEPRHSLRDSRLDGGAAAAELRLEPILALEPIRAVELAAGLGSVSGALTSSRGDLATGPVHLAVARELPRLWQLRLAAGRDAAAFDVSYRLVADNGRRDQLSNPLDPGAAIVARLEPLPPVVVRRSADESVVEGGATLLLDLSQVRLAGSYQGTLTVILSQL